MKTSRRTFLAGASDAALMLDRDQAVAWIHGSSAAAPTSPLQSQRNVLNVNFSYGIDGRRRRLARNPIPTNPISSIAHVEGSGTAARSLCPMFVPPVLLKVLMRGSNCSEIL
jgi:hypothetical protein